MALKKSELYSSLWKSCDELRGGMDASQYKDYVLTLLFVKYVSDKYADDPNALILVPEGGSFSDMVELKGDKEIGDKINIIIGRLAEENDLKGVIDVADFNDEDKLGKGKEMVDRLSKLVAIFDGINLLELSEKQMRDVRGNLVSMIYQEPMTSLNPVFTVGNQISEAIRRHQKVSKNRATELAVEMLQKVGIPNPKKRLKDPISGYVLPAINATSIVPRPLNFHTSS